MIETKTTLTGQSQEKVLEKVKKILSKTEKNDSVAECQTALLMAQELLAKNGLTMEDIKYSNLSPKEILEEDILSRGKIEAWRKRLSTVIANNFRCKLYMDYDDYMKKIVFLGVKEDVELAKTIFRHATTMITHHSEEFTLKIKADVESKKNIKTKKTQYNNIKNDFINGFIMGIEKKFEEQVKQNNWGLVLIPDKEVEEKFNELDLRKYTRYHRNYDSNPIAIKEGYNKGMEYTVCSGEITN